MAGFDGFPRDALTFLWELRANNNVAFYEANKERCEKALRLPLRALCEEVAPVVRLVDPGLDTRPGSVMSRLRRDTRFTRDKSPFRDHVWLGWRYPGERRSEGFHMYWGFGTDWLGWGCGSYGPDKPLMDALRLRIRREPEAVREALRPLELGRRYTLYGEPFRKLAVPEDVPEDLRALYRMKYFGAQSVPETADWEMLWSHAAAECVTAELERMGPVLRLMAQCRQERQLAQEAPEEQKKAPGLGRHRARSVEEFEF